jgi:hypothetical protein
MDVEKFFTTNNLWHPKVHGRIILKLILEVYILKIQLRQNRIQWQDFGITEINSLVLQTDKIFDQLNVWQLLKVREWVQ